MVPSPQELTVEGSSCSFSFTHTRVPCNTHTTKTHRYTQTHTSSVQDNFTAPYSVFQIIISDSSAEKRLKFGLLTNVFLLTSKLFPVQTHRRNELCVIKFLLSFNHSGLGLVVMEQVRVSGMEIDLLQRHSIRDAQSLQLSPQHTTFTL